METFKSRKFVISVAVMVMAYVLVFVGKLEGRAWFEWAVGLVGVYGAANVVEGLKK